jgi:hypothetical protein
MIDGVFVEYLIEDFDLDLLHQKLIAIEYYYDEMVDDRVFQNLRIASV